MEETAARRITDDLIAERMPQRVTVHITRAMAYDFDTMTKITRNVLGKLGCDGCHSGRVLDWVIVENYAINPKTLQPQELLPGQQLGG